MIALFPQTDPSLKTPDGREATNPDNLVCRAVRAIKAARAGDRRACATWRSILTPTTAMTA